ncbi:protein of unknown function [Taphrina deformans PYCC 5710]|uniref:Uncharacterized protein n=1 Tax=Taphrina deformans (strain PYCC 5710 / ATCC 11124 / CBS 356.35 / IMI 108563 / JCM 9778 / NBRC 8474) TaxID=1097556 RepID=R4XG71_TAPDE|nr:protein of unknown function [Taphrina deformans PYCC 5710]|eukprot:CCG84889.1 protein of unknown function [Taphrina deformans PYCC 5710]
MPTLTTISTSLALAPTYKPVNLITAYSIILKGRNRLLRISLLYNKYTNNRAAASAITHLPSFLRQKFGDGAVGILVGDVVYKNDEELMRDATIKSNEEYFVLYEDYTPSYVECLTTPPMYNDTRSSSEGRHLPGYKDAQVTGYLRPAYFEELVYYPTIPIVTKTITIKLSFGRKASIKLSNKCTDHADNFRHLLYLKAGYKAQGIATPDGTIYRNDEILFNDEIEDGGIYKLVTGKGYSLTAPAQERPPLTQRNSSTREALDTSLRRISSGTNRSMHRVSSRTSTNSHERSSAGIRAK